MLKQIRKNIYAFDEKIEKSFTLIAVHPFYRDLDRKAETTYRTNFENLLLNHKGNFLTLESYEVLLETAGIYQKIGRTKDLYFIATEKRNPKPKKNSWKFLRSFLSELSEGEILLVGGFYFNDYKGCLGRVESRLKDYFDLKVLKDITFNDFYDLENL